MLRKADQLTGYSAIVANLPQGDRRVADWFGMVQLMRTMKDNGLPDLFGAVRELKVIADWKSGFTRPVILAGNVVTLTTIHGSKGLEWPVVIVPDLNTRTGGSGFERLVIDPEIGVTFNLEREDDDRNGRKPAIYELIKRRRRKKDEDEERRLLYVAITRARDRVMLTSGAMTPPKPGAGRASKTLYQFLGPAIDNGYLTIENIPTPLNVHPPTPRPAEAFEVPALRHPETIPLGLYRLAASSIDDYHACPKKFEFRHVKGHPGLGVGAARSSTVGTLTHRALQFEINSIEELERIAEGAPKEYVSEAFELAGRFRSDIVFNEFQGSGLEREKPFSFEYRGMRILGSADLVGEDFVLDYKTGEESDPRDYQLQLWAYSKALAKPRAFVANLRRPKIYEFTAVELRRAEETANDLITRIAAGDYDPDPSPAKCSRCAYASICDSAADGAKGSKPRSMTAPGQQLELF